MVDRTVDPPRRPGAGPSPGCPACSPAAHIIPAAPADQAEYMGVLAEYIGGYPDDQPMSHTALADIAHAVAVIGAAVVAADASYAEGLRQGNAAARHAVALSMQGRRWRVGADCGEVFDDDVEFVGTTLILELKSPQEARAVAGLLLEIAGTEGGDG